MFAATADLLVFLGAPFLAVERTFGLTHEVYRGCDALRCSAAWLTAWEFRGPNSTIRRRSTVETLFSQHLPYFRLDNAIAVAFINEVDSLVQKAIAEAKDKLRGARDSDNEDGTKAA
jgi:hypothetical protein